MCVKGRMLGLAHHDARRFDRAMVGRPPGRVAVGVDDALDDLGRRLRDLIERFGPDSVGVFQGTQAIQESGAAGAVPRFVGALGTRSFYSIVSIDNIARCVAGLEMTGGRHTLSPKADYANTRFLLVFGANPVVSHSQGTTNPVVKLRRIASRGQVWVVDPRRTETANLATRHLQIRAGADCFLLAHILRELLREGADLEYLRDHTTGVEELRRAVEPHTRAATARRTGLSVDALDELLAEIRAAGTISVTSGTGTRMGRTPTTTEWLLFALMIVSGSMDRVGGTTLIGRGLALAPPGAVAKAPGPASRPDLAMWAGQAPCTALADEIEAGNLKALLCFGGNPAGAIPETARVRDALGALDVFAVHDIVPTQSTDLATHVLPGTSELEDASVVASLTPEGRRFMQYAPALFAPTADRHPTWWYVDEIATRLGLEVFAQPVTEDEAHSPQHGFTDLRKVREAPGAMMVGDVLATGSITDDLPGGRWHLAPPDLVAELDAIEELPELLLIPRRQARHMNWSLTDLVGPSGKRDDPDLLIHPEDAARAGVDHGASVVAATAHGELVVRANVTEDIARGAVSIPHGHREVELNVLTSTHVDVDAISGMPLQGGVPISVRPAATSSR